MKASNNICIHFYELEHRMLNQLEKNRDWDGIGAKYTQVQEDFGDWEAVRGGRARPASGASCRGVWAALRHTPGQPQQASGGSREVEHGTAGAAA